MTELEAKKLVSKLLASWEDKAKEYKKITVAIPTTGLKAVISESDTGDFVVVTVKSKDEENFDNKSMQIGKIRNRRNR